MIEAIPTLLLVYGAVGLLCSLALHRFGLRRIDPATVGSGLWFRLLITPGLIALWPLMLARWRQAVRDGAPAPGEVHLPLGASAIRRMHAHLAIALVVLAPLLLVLSRCR